MLKEAPEGAEIFDLEALQLARREAREDQPFPVMKLSSGFVELTRELPLAAAEDFAHAEWRAGLEKIVRDKADVDEIFAAGLTREDISSIGMFLVGRSLGE